MAVYYVKNGGNDGADGLSDGNAWATVSHVNGQTFFPGDSVLFRSGDQWYERLDVPSSGAVGNPLTIGSYGTGAYPVFKGSAVIANSGWSLSAGQTVTYEKALAVDPRNCFFENSVPLALQTSIANVEATAGSYFWAANVLYVHASDSSNPNSNGKLYEASARSECINVSSKDYVVVEYVTVMHSNDDGLRFDGTSSGCVARNMTAMLLERWGVVFGGSTCVNGTISHVVANGCVRSLTQGSGGVGGEALNSFVVEYCECANNGNDLWLQHGIYITKSLDGTVARYNTSHNNASAGLKFGADSGATETVGHHNVTWENGRFGVMVDVGSRISLLANHTDYGSLWGLELHADGGNVTVDEVRNCVFSGSDEFGVFLNENGGTATITTFTNNDVFGAGTSNYSGIVDQTGSNGNISANPRFKNLPSFDLTLAGNSPCIDAGVAIFGVTDGYQGSAPDMGAFEQAVGAQALSMQSHVFGHSIW